MLKPYRLPSASFITASKKFTPEDAALFIRPRGNVFAILVPQGAKRYQLYQHESGQRIFDANGKPFDDVLGTDRGQLLLDLVRRLPNNTGVEVYANDKRVIVSDVLMFVNKDMRRETTEDRLSSYWFMPREFNASVFFNSTNLDKLDSNLYFPDIGKIIFKPNFVRYPVTSGKQLFNWHVLERPDFVAEDPRNDSGPIVRTTGNQGS